MWFRTHSLYVLLPAFILVGILAMVREISVPPHPYHPGEGELAGKVAHRPAEFREIFDFDPLEGLNSQGRNEYHVPPPPLSKFPCTECHDKASNNRERREIDESKHPKTLNHGEKWCLDCHDFDDRDKLHLTNGEKVPFEESYRLCGQCHGDKYRDWKAGIHGKRSGYWNGEKRYLLCVHCHSPHEPRFKSMKPLPPPVRPEYLRKAPLAAPEAPQQAPSPGPSGTVPTSEAK